MWKWSGSGSVAPGGGGVTSAPLTSTTTAAVCAAGAAPYVVACCCCCCLSWCWSTRCQSTAWTDCARPSNDGSTSGRPRWAASKSSKPSKSFTGGGARRAVERLSPNLRPSSSLGLYGTAGTRPVDVAGIAGRRRGEPLWLRSKDEPRSYIIEDTKSYIQGTANQYVYSRFDDQERKYKLDSLVCPPQLAQCFQVRKKSER